MFFFAELAPESVGVLQVALHKIERAAWNRLLWLHVHGSFPLLAEVALLVLFYVWKTALLVIEVPQHGNWLSLRRKMFFKALYFHKTLL